MENFVVDMITLALGKFGDKNVVGIFFLLFENGNDFLPSSPESVRSPWKILFDGFAEPRQIVEGDSGEHMMFHVILHVPVEKGGQPTAGVCAATKAKICHIG